MLALPAREQAEQRWQAAVAVLAQSMGVRLITHIAVQSLKKLAKNDDREPPASLRSQIECLRQLEGQSQPTVERPTTRWRARRPPTRN